MKGLRATGLTFISLGFLFVAITVMRLVGNQFFPDIPLLHLLIAPLCMVLVCLILYRFYGKDRWSLGWKDKNAAGNFVSGAMYAIIIVAIASTVIFASSSIEVITDTWDGLSIMNQIGIILFTTVGYETFFRGYLYSAVYAISNLNSAVMVTSITFSIVYLLNSDSINHVPYESIAIGWLNMFLVSLLLNQARIYSGSLWMPIGLHFLFHVTQSTVFGFVYGGKQFESFFTVAYISDSLINGGKLGIEASILWSPILIIAILCFNKFIHSKNTDKNFSNF